MKNSPDIDLAPFRHLYPFTSRFLDIQGLGYHYIDEGRGDPVVMLHGNPTWSFYYRRLVTGLAADYRTIVPDHMGCGLSAKPGRQRYAHRLKSRVDDLERLLDHLGISRNITLVLHDWGGMIGMAYALRHPRRIARLVVMNTAAFLAPENKRLPLRLRLIRNGGPLAALLVQGFNLFSRAALVMAAAKPLPADVKKGLTAPYNNWRNRLATLTFVEDIPLDPRDASYALVREVDSGLHRLASIPLLICWGGRDFVFDRDYLAEWCRRFPEAEVRRFENAGHYVLEDVPHEVYACIQDFLKRHPLNAKAVDSEGQKRNPDGA